MVSYLYTSPIKHSVGKIRNASPHQVVHLRESEGLALAAKRNAVFASGETFDGFNSLDDMGVMEYLLPGTPVDITILHIPSNTIIYEKEVVVL